MKGVPVSGLGKDLPARARVVVIGGGVTGCSEELAQAPGSALVEADRNNPRKIQVESFLSHQDQSMEKLNA